jgi:hypothetical protein
LPPVWAAVLGTLFVVLPLAGGGTVLAPEPPEPPEPPGATDVAVELPDAGAVDVGDVVEEVVLELLESPEPLPPPHAATSGARASVKAAQATIDLR